MNRQVWLYSSLSAGLIALYATAAFFALHPNTSDSYRAYFIDRTRALPDDDGSRLRPLNPGQWVAHDSNDVGYTGFSGPEPEFRWTSAKSVSVLIDAACGPQWHSLVKFKLSSNGVQRAMLSLNGGSKILTVVQPQQAEVDVQFPQGALKCGQNKLDIELPDARSPSPQDSRLLALALRALSVE